MIELKMSFKDVMELKDFLSGIDTAINYELPADKIEAVSVDEQDIKSTLQEPVDIESPAVETEPINKTVGPKITGKMVADALKSYKASNGRAAYRELLASYGAGTQRQIDKSDYAGVIKQCEAVTPDEQKSEMAEASKEQELITVEQVMQSLTDHKARHGLDTTMGIIKSLGFESAAEIPPHKYVDLLKALSDYPNEVLEEDNSDIDLSEF